MSCSWSTAHLCSAATDGWLGRGQRSRYARARYWDAWLWRHLSAASRSQHLGFWGMHGNAVTLAAELDTRTRVLLAEGAERVNCTTEQEQLKLSCACFWADKYDSQAGSMNIWRLHGSLLLDDVPRRWLGHAGK